jgi:Asp-tRNA(Asn)/Glu-tRNA(Gln) amidotransferase A subunit family amidase
MQFGFAPLRDLSKQISAGSLSAAELARTCLDRIAAYDDKVRAWTWLDPKSVEETAQFLDGVRLMGPLHGIPIGVKDVLDTCDMPTGYGSAIYAKHLPAADSSVVAAARAAGGLICGKTVTCEFAGGHPSKTRNPADPAHTPGGSSSGSAAAVGAGMVPVALGTQTAGSIVRPASYCGVVGFKPTFGFINRAGLKPLSESFDTIGVLAARADDAAWFTACLTGRPELADRTVPIERPRLLICRTDFWHQAEEAGVEAFNIAVDRLRKHGAIITEANLPFSCTDLTRYGTKILTVDARRALAHELRTAPEQISTKMIEFLRFAEGETSAIYDIAQAEVAEARRQFDTYMAGYDAVITLSAPGEAPVGFATTGNACFNFTWSMLHTPCISLPGLSGPTGLPIGIQLVAPRGSDATLLRLAIWAEGALQTRTHV